MVPRVHREVGLNHIQDVIDHLFSNIWRGLMRSSLHEETVAAWLTKSECWNFSNIKDWSLYTDLVN